MRRGLQTPEAPFDVDEQKLGSWHYKSNLTESQQQPVNPHAQRLLVAARKATTLAKKKEPKAKAKAKAKPKAKASKASAKKHQSTTQNEKAGGGKNKKRPDTIYNVERKKFFATLLACTLLLAL